MATLTAATIPQWINGAITGKLRAALQALFAKANVDLLAVEARALLLETYTPINCTASTLTVTAATHANKTITLNRAGGIAVDLPAATGTGATYTFIVGTTFTTAGTISVVGNDTMVGLALGLVRIKDLHQGAIVDLEQTLKEHDTETMVEKP